MPLYSFKCMECENIVEKFLYKVEESEVVCDLCGKKCIKVFGKISKRKKRSPQELFEEKISPDVDRIMEKVEGGSDKDFLDIVGE